MTGSQIHLPRLSCSSCRSNAVALQTEINEFVVNSKYLLYGVEIQDFPDRFRIQLLSLINNCHFYVQQNNFSKICIAAYRVNYRPQT